MKCTLLLLIAVLAGICSGQTAAEEPGAGSPLSYRIELYKVDKRNGLLTVKQILVNVSHEKVVLDRKALGYRVSFTRLGGASPDGGLEGNEGMTMTGTYSTDYVGDYLLLSPKECYQQSQVLSFKGSFFDKPGTYKASLSYGFFLDHEIDGTPVWTGVVDSNEIRFTK